MRGLFPFLLFLVLVFAAPALARAQDLVVYAAASLGGALDEIGAAWAVGTGGRLTPVFAGSSALARQIAAGARADLVILANVAWMDDLQSRGAIAPETRTNLLGNSLVLITGAEDATPLDITDPEALAQRLGRGRLALALTEAVPVGIYARAALESLGHWVSVAGRVVESDNARTALSLVAMRAADLGIVYATDAAAEPRVHVIAAIPPDTHDPIVYPAALTPSAQPGAGAFLTYLGGPEARAIWTAHGFTVLGQP